MENKVNQTIKNLLNTMIVKLRRELNNFRIEEIEVIQFSNYFELKVKYLNNTITTIRTSYYKLISEPNLLLKNISEYLSYRLQEVKEESRKNIINELTNLILSVSFKVGILPGSDNYVSNMSKELIKDIFDSLDSVENNLNSSVFIKEILTEKERLYYRDSIIKLDDFIYNHYIFIPGLTNDKLLNKMLQQLSSGEVKYIIDNLKLSNNNSFRRSIVNEYNYITNMTNVDLQTLRKLTKIIEMLGA